jgi:hypothetical protein
MADLRELLRDAEPPPPAADVDAIIGRGDHLRRRRQVVLGVSAAIVLALVATVLVVNRSGAPSDAPLAVLAGTEDAARDAGSARMHAEVTITGGGQTGRMEISGVASFSDDPTELTVVVDGTPSTMIIDGPTTYLSVPEAERTTTEGRPWLAYPTASRNDDTLDLGDDPSQVLAVLQRATHVSTVGRERVNGFATTHYRARIAEAPDVQVDVWVTDDGLATRIKADIPFLSVRMRFTEDFTDFGVDVPAIELPSPTDVFKGSESMATWHLPRLLSTATMELACGLLSGGTEALRQQTFDVSADVLAEWQRALRDLETRIGSIDESTPEGAREKAALEQSAEMIRALVAAATSGQPVGDVIPQFNGSIPTECGR